ncbi:MAG: hypothetical protein V2J24_13280 [Pseudomonadales bacterium]|jgi:hypothetical protein|nr:hypothetical protein [Pseudomonadales bacterium]
MRALLALLCLSCALAPAAEGADSMRTTRLLLETGLLGDAEQAQRLYVDELIRLGLPDDGDEEFALAVRAAFPASRIRDRWIRLLAEQLTDAELAAAEGFHGSVPGQSFSEALAATRAAGTDVSGAPVELAKAARDMEAHAREAVLRIRTIGAARWLVRREAGETDARLEDAWQESLAEYGRAERATELRALLVMPPLHAAGLAEFARSTEGRRFYGKLTAALDVALTELAREHRGFVLRALERRALERTSQNSR